MKSLNDMKHEISSLHYQDLGIASPKENEGSVKTRPSSQFKNIIIP